METAADFTPLCAWILSSSVSKKASCFSLEPYLVKSRPICIVNTFSGWKPGFTCCSFAKLRSINPAPIKRRNDTATCATISKLLIRCLPRPIVDCTPPSFRPPTTVSRAARAGAVPDSMLVRSATPSVKSNTVASR